MFLYGLCLVPVFFVLVKIHSKRTRSHCVSSDQVAKALLTCCVTFDRRRCDVCMANRCCYEHATIFLKTGLKNCRTLENEAIVQRRTATLKVFDAVALQWLSLRFQIRHTFASQFAIGLIRKIPTLKPLYLEIIW